MRPTEPMAPLPSRSSVRGFAHGAAIGPPLPGAEKDQPQLLDRTRGELVLELADEVADLARDRLADHRTAADALAGEELERAIVGEHVADEALHGALDGKVARALRRHARLADDRAQGHADVVDQRQAE